MNSTQPDLFSHSPAQSDLFADNQPIPSYRPEPADIRGRLTVMLAEAKAAKSKSPWDGRKTRLYQVIFPQMAKWLPSEEAEQLCFEFAREMERLRLAA
jgi:hypothetical protein